MTWKDWFEFTLTMISFLTGSAMIGIMLRISFQSRNQQIIEQNIAEKTLELILGLPPFQPKKK